MSVSECFRALAVDVVKRDLASDRLLGCHREVASRGAADRSPFPECRLLKLPVDTATKVTKEGGRILAGVPPWVHVKHTAPPAGEERWRLDRSGRTRKR